MATYKLKSGEVLVLVGSDDGVAVLQGTLQHREAAAAYEVAVDPQLNVIEAGGERPELKVELVRDGHYGGYLCVLSHRGDDGGVGLVYNAIASNQRDPVVEGQPFASYVELHLEPEGRRAGVDRIVEAITDLMDIAGGAVNAHGHDDVDAAHDGNLSGESAVRGGL